MGPKPSAKRSPPFFRQSLDKLLEGDLPHTGQVDQAESLGGFTPICVVGAGARTDPVLGLEALQRAVVEAQWLPDRLP
jgi:hypothetical protein